MMMSGRGLLFLIKERKRESAKLAVLKQARSRVAVGKQIYSWDFGSLFG